MVISHVNKYVFVELPRTGSTAINKELREQYDGVRILNKHSMYHDFLRVATPAEKKYFVFSCIRNPLDVAVSRYFQYKSDHQYIYTDPVKRARNNGIGGYIDNKIYDYVQRKDLDFPAFFLMFYRFPYNTWASLSHRQFDFVIRFEHLADDFTQALQLIGIEPKRRLPLTNRTSARDRNFLSYYTPETIARAKWVFGPYMKQWGYQFPSEWGDTALPWWNQVQFELLNMFKSLYWKHLKDRLWPSRIQRV